MDAYPTDTATRYDFNGPPALIIASSDTAMARAESTLTGFGIRIGAKLSVESAVDRVRVQPSARAIWVEIDQDCGGPLDALLDTIAGDVRNHRYAAVVSTNEQTLDAVAARLDEPAVEILVEADEQERASALTIAASWRSFAGKIGDVAKDNNADRLRQLSEEVSRIASTLARLSTGPDAPAGVRPVADVDLPPISGETVASVIRARRLRGRYFSEELFADPAWDMLLDLLHAEIAQLRVPVSSLCIAAAVPATTALRWLKTLVADGIFIRRADPRDGRRVFVELAPQASHALRSYFAEVGKLAVI